MATRLKKIVSEDVEVHNEIEEMRAELEALEAMKEEPPPINEALESLYAEMEITGELDSARVFVSKLNFDGANNEARVWEGDAESYNLERIAKKFGSGQYRVKVYVRVPSGHRVQKAAKVYGFMLSKEDEARLAAPVAAPAQSGGLTINDVEMLFARFASQMQPAAPAPQANPLAMMREIAEVMKVMAPPPPPANSGGMGQMRDMIEIVQMMRESEAPAGGAGTMDVLMQLANKFGPAIATVIQQNAVQGAAQAMQTPQIQSNPQPLAQPQAAPQEEDMSKLQEMQLKMGLGYLVTMAEHAAPPETYAAVILDYAPEENLNQLLAIPGGPIEALSKLEPRVKEHAAWFEQVFAELRILMAPELDTTQNPEEVKP